jgi:hypothetical protein
MTTIASWLDSEPLKEHIRLVDELQRNWISDIDGIRQKLLQKALIIDSALASEMKDSVVGQVEELRKLEERLSAPALCDFTKVLPVTDHLGALIPPQSESFLETLGLKERMEHSHKVQEAFGAAGFIPTPSMPSSLVDEVVTPMAAAPL